MTSRAVVKREVREIRIAARVAELRRLAQSTATAYREDELLAKAREVLDRRAADSDLPPEHRRLRMMLLGRLLSPPRPSSRE